jgi:hypothetical protein
MKSLKFNGDITLEEVFNEHKALIYDSVVHSIKENLSSSNSDDVPIIGITINQVEYSINLGRDKFDRSLAQAISFYEELEEYEKCQMCLTLKQELKKNKEKATNGI